MDQKTTQLYRFHTNAYIMKQMFQTYVNIFLHKNFGSPIEDIIMRSQK